MIALLMLALTVATASARDFHVAGRGDDKNDGSTASPYRTISAAAQAAQPGDTITVHEGTYRERVTPPRGGTSDTQRIVYQAAPGEKVVIKDRKSFASGSLLRRANPSLRPCGRRRCRMRSSALQPLQRPDRGRLVQALGRPHHTGEVYINGKSLWKPTFSKRVLNPRPVATPTTRKARRGPGLRK